MEPVPNGAFRSRNSCPLAEGTSANAISSGFLCSNCSSEPERDIHKRHIEWISLFELPIGTRKGTSTNAISSGFLCSNCPSEPGRDIHKHHIKQFSLFERAIGDRIMARLAKLASQQRLSAVFGIPPYSLRHARHRGQGLFIAKLSGQECRRDMHPTQS